MASQIQQQRVVSAAVAGGAAVCAALTLYAWAQQRSKSAELYEGASASGLAQASAASCPPEAFSALDQPPADGSPDLAGSSLRAREADEVLARALALARKALELKDEIAAGRSPHLQHALGYGWFWNLERKIGILRDELGAAPESWVAGRALSLRALEATIEDLTAEGHPAHVALLCDQPRHVAVLRALQELLGNPWDDAEEEDCFFVPDVKVHNFGG